MPLIPTQLSYLPDFEGRGDLYSNLSPEIFPAPTMSRIRTFAILPNQDRNAPIEGSLRIEKFSPELYTYHAISYYWVNADDVGHVTVHGSDDGRLSRSFQVPVTSSLIAALGHFRAIADTPSGLLRIWTDALCINQRDSKERNVQVAIMKYIFRNSVSVLIWLGEPNDLAENGLNSLVRLGVRYGIPSLHMTDKSSNDMILATTRSWTLQDFVDCRLAIDALLELPYWWRGWTVQEAAATTACIFLGHTEVRVTDLRDVFRTIQMFLREFLESPKYLLQTRLNILKSVEQWQLALLRFSVTQKGQSLQLRKRYSWTFGQTRDPRDTIFSLIGHRTAFVKLEPRYECSIGKVYTDATVALLQFHGSWSFCHWEHPSGSPYLPSWCLDFTDCSPVFDENGCIFAFATASDDSDASSGAPIRLDRHDQNTLLAAGFVFDRIESISDCLEWAKIADISAIRKAVAKWWIMAVRAKWISISGFFRTICMDNMLNRRYQPRDYALIYSMLFAELPFSTWRHLVLEVMAEEGMNNPATAIDRVSEAAEYVFLKIVWCRFAVTREGHYGLVPRYAEVGDNLAILASGNIPFVLRSVPAEYVGREAYRITGGCYIDGTQKARQALDANSLTVLGHMHGEAVYKEAERLCGIQEGKLSARMMFSASKLAPFSHGASKRRSKAANELAFENSLCLV